mmetsp:Transcript_11164/g.35620  ORF Transcript_11164/g.35620 Transcript_11164/m.35620 type:complete len:264 (-) Transcript_11164:579-1370(-)
MDQRAQPGALHVPPTAAAVGGAQRQQRCCRRGRGARRARASDDPAAPGLDWQPGPAALCRAWAACVPHARAAQPHAALPAGAERGQLPRRLWPRPGLRHVPGRLHDRRRPLRGRVGEAGEAAERLARARGGVAARERALWGALAHEQPRQGALARGGRRRRRRRREWWRRGRRQLVWRRLASQRRCGQGRRGGQRHGRRVRGVARRRALAPRRGHAQPHPPPAPGQRPLTVGADAVARAPAAALCLWLPLHALLVRALGAVSL